MKKLASFVLCLGLLNSLNAAIFGDDDANIKGSYLTHIGNSGRQSIVQFFNKNNKLYAFGYANVDGSGPKKDTKNKKESLRERFDKGSVFVYGLKKKSDNVYDGGEIYNYDDGKTYYLKITIEKNGNLTLRASIDKLGMMGETLVWTPLDEAKTKQYEKELPESSVVENSFNNEIEKEFK